MNAPKRHARPGKLFPTENKVPSGKNGKKDSGEPSQPNANQFGQGFVKEWGTNKVRKTWGA